MNLQVFRHWVKTVMVSTSSQHGTLIISMIVSHGWLMDLSWIWLTQGALRNILAHGLIPGLALPIQVYRRNWWIGSIGLGICLLNLFRKSIYLELTPSRDVVYLADHTKISVGLLEPLDLLVRKFVKEWLHLPPSTCDAILYSSYKDGCLGIIKLVALIPIFRCGDRIDWHSLRIRLWWVFWEGSIWNCYLRSYCCILEGRRSPSRWFGSLFQW